MISKTTWVRQCSLILVVCWYFVLKTLLSLWNAFGVDLIQTESGEAKTNCNLLQLKMVPHK